METLATIFQFLFGLSVLAFAFHDVGKLPGGPSRPSVPAVKPRPIVLTSTAPANDPGNGFEEITVLDAEEWETIQRQNEIKTKINRRAAELKAAGVEITNLENW